MNNSNYIFDFKLEEIQADNCEEIVNYLTIRDKWIAYYNEFGFSYPATSDNNFRDSWFHYRKIYKERSRNEIIRQIANYEEHLQRAERDLVVKFFQDISSSLEKWYLYGLNSQLETIEEYAQIAELWKKESECFDAGDKIKSGWVNSIYLFCEKNRKTKDDFRNIVLYIFRAYIWNDELKLELQKLIHKLKNIVLKVRLGSSEIDRMDKVGQLTEQCVILYEELIEFCNKQVLKEVTILAIE